MRNKIIAALVAGGLLVGAGFVTSLVSAPSTASAQEDTAAADKGPFHRGFEFLSGVLDELVAENTISQEDADAVLDAVEEKAAGMKADHEAMRELIKGFLEDGVLTKAEFDQLPADNPFAHERFDEAWGDDELSQEEIREARPHPQRDLFKRGARFGALLDDGGIDKDEYDALGDDHPLKQIAVAEYLADNLITPEELREIWQAHRSGSQTDNQGA